MQTSTYSLKRKALGDLTNCSIDEETGPLKTDHNLCSDAVEMMPNITETSRIPSYERERFQNVHPLLGWYKHDLRTGFLPYDDFSDLMKPDNDIQLIELLEQIGVIADSNPCMMCGGFMKKHKEGAHWFWICRRRVEGVKCQIKKKAYGLAQCSKAVSYQSSVFSELFGTSSIICLNSNVWTIPILAQRITQLL